MLTYTLAHIVNAPLFAGIFGATFALNEDDDATTSTSTPPTDPADDGAAEFVAGGDGDDLLTSTDPDGANFVAGDGAAEFVAPIKTIRYRQALATMSPK